MKITGIAKKTGADKGGNRSLFPKQVDNLKQLCIDRGDKKVVVLGLQCLIQAIAP